MEEIEPPMENVHEDIHHHAHHAPESWVSWVALSTAILAALAAITALLSGMHANEAMMEKVEASDQFSWYQAKSIKSGQLNTKNDILKALDKTPSEKDVKKLEEYEHEMEKIKEQADHAKHESKANFELHETYARGVTLFQIAITIAAISVLTKKKQFWLYGLVFGCVGTGYLIWGLKTDIPRWLAAPPAAHAEEHK
jgi:lipopolysaccharide export LptBFGC system permease protein LptF